MTRRRVVCSLILTLYLLTAATALSRWIEREMITQILEREVRYDHYSNQWVEMPLSSMFTANRTDYLFELVEGVGWEQGERIQIISPSSYNIDPIYSHVLLFCERDYRVVRSASRFPRVGEKAETIKPGRFRDDRYLAVYDGRIPEPSDRPFGQLISSMESVAQSEHAMLITVRQGLDPFFQHYAKGTSIITDAANRIFSLTDVESFLEQLPLLAALAALVIAPVELWVWSCCLLRRERWGAVAVNAVLAAAAGVLIFRLLGRIDLPSSLMPTENIFELDYYAQELRTVADVLRALGNPAPDVFAAMETARQSVLRTALTGLLLPLGVIILEALLGKRAKKTTPSA